MAEHPEAPVGLQLLSALTKAPRGATTDMPTSNNSITMASKAGMNALQRAFTEFPGLVENLGSETKAFAIVYDLMGAVSPFMPSSGQRTKNITPSQEGRLIDGIEALDNALPQGQPEENARLNAGRNPYSPEALGGRSMSAPSPMSAPMSPPVPMGPPTRPPPPPPPQMSNLMSAAGAGPPMGRQPPAAPPMQASRPPVSASSSMPMPTAPTGPAVNPMQQGIAPAAPQRAPITATGPGYAGDVGASARSQGQANTQSFREAFDAAKKSGKSTFSWQGNIYTTELASDKPSTTAPARR